MAVKCHGVNRTATKMRRIQPASSVGGNTRSLVAVKCHGVNRTATKMRRIQPASSVVVIPGV